ncbi:MAG TPA: hypothetical protein VMU77_07420, partial [Acidimicrobiales bacterium]|nr:hypothetical protein [Acidimicrobiales bacterium]
MRVRGAIGTAVFSIGALALSVLVVPSTAGATTAGAMNSSVNGAVAPRVPGTIAPAQTIGIGHIVRPRPHAAPGGTGWTVQVSGISLSQISCPVSTNCWAVGQYSSTSAGVILASSNSGATWSSQTVPVDVTLSSISCPALNICFAVGDSPVKTSEILGTTDGSTWSVQQPPLLTSLPGEPEVPATYSLTSVSCVDTLHCWAIGNSGAYASLVGLPPYSSVIQTSDGGSSWTLSTSSLPLGLRSLSCIAPSTCVAAGGSSIAVSQNSGTTWTVEPSVSTSLSQALSSVACSPTSTSVNCWIVGTGSTAFFSSNAGVSWTPQAVPVQGGLSAISCPSSSECIAVGTNQNQGYPGPCCFIGQAGTTIVETTNAGSTWVSGYAPIQGGLSAVSCSDIKNCWATSSTASSTGTIVGSTTGGASWNTVLGASSYDPAEQSFDAVTCVTSAACWAVGGSSSGNGNSSVSFSSDGGVSWVPQAVPSNYYSPFSAIACPSATTCYAVGGGENIISTIDGGAAWSADTLTTTQGQYSYKDLTSISCTDVSHCLAIGDSTIFQTSNGSDWYQGNAFPALGLNKVYCFPGSQDCWVVGGSNLYASQNGGTTWAAQPLPPSVILPDLTTITCSTITDCLASGTDLTEVNGTISTGDLILQSTNQGGNWTIQLETLAAGQSASGRINSSQCSGQTCYIVGDRYFGFGYGGFPEGAFVLASNDGGATWKAQISMQSAHFSDIACWNPQSCVLVGVSPLQGSYGFGYPGGLSTYYNGGGLVLTTSDGGVPGSPVVSEVTPSILLTDTIGLLLVSGTNLSTVTSMEIGTKAIVIYESSGGDTIGVALPPSYEAQQSSANISVTTPYGTSPASAANLVTFVPPTPLQPGKGYWTATQSGMVNSFGAAPSYGELLVAPAAPIVAMRATNDGAGYWLAGSDGGVFAFGDAFYFGSTGSIHLASPIASMAAMPDGNGYWLVGSDGGVFAFGEALFYGSTGAMHLASSIVSIVSTPDGKGYWLVGSDGGVFAFG